MKTKMFSLLGLFLIGTLGVFAQTKTENFEVKGNCGMCESRIEKASQSVEGVSSADWNQETKMLEITFDSTKTNMSEIQMTIAKVGHDTPLYKAEDKVYNKLHGCCQYDRTVEKADPHAGHKH